MSASDSEDYYETTDTESESEDHYYEKCDIRCMGYLTVPVRGKISLPLHYGIEPDTRNPTKQWRIDNWGCETNVHNLERRSFYYGLPEPITEYRYYTYGGPPLTWLETMVVQKPIGEVIMGWYNLYEPKWQEVVYEDGVKKAEYSFDEKVDHTWSNYKSEALAHLQRQLELGKRLDSEQLIDWYAGCFTESFMNMVNERVNYFWVNRSAVDLISARVEQEFIKILEQQFHAAVTIKRFFARFSRVYAKRIYLAQVQDFAEYPGDASSELALLRRGGYLYQEAARSEGAQLMNQ